MLSADNISYVASKLIESKFLSDTLQPSHLLSQLEALYTYNTGVIVNITHIDNNEITAFLNSTLPCIYEKLNQSAGSNDVMENILTSWSVFLIFIFLLLINCLIINVRKEFKCIISFLLTVFIYYQY